jgi:hypothetical protein
MPLDAAGLGHHRQALKSGRSSCWRKRSIRGNWRTACHALGYSYFQGYYFAKPTIIAGKKLGIPN